MIDATRPVRTPAQFIPTPEQIRAGCLAIQAGWSAEEEYSRRRCDWRSGPWAVPEMAVVENPELSD